VDPARATQLALGYWPARAFSAAAEVGVFTLLDAEGPLDTDTIAERLGLRSPSLPHLLDALVALGALGRDDDRYSVIIAPDSALVVAADGAAYRAWADLPDALRGGPRTSMFDGMTAEATARFVEAMGSVTAGAHAGVAELVSEGEHVCDVGGSDGRLAIALARAGARVTTFDRPALVPLAQRAVADAGVDEHVTVVGGDFFLDPIPASDTAVLSVVLLDWDTDAKRRLLQRVAASSGRIIVVDRLVRPERPTATFELLRSLHLLVTVGDAFHYTGDELAGWLAEVGFRAKPGRELPGGFTLVEARPE
jgi:predicted O-methyltransferase YrrM